MKMELTEYLGRAASELLKAEPFSRWHVVCTKENDPKPEICYEFDGHGVEVICDRFDRVQTVFVHRGQGESLVDFPFAMGRRQVLERLGTPEKSGRAGQIPVLGNFGAWDLFRLPRFSLHVQYRVDRDEIDMITLMVPDAVP